MIKISKERLLKIQQWREVFGADNNVVLPAEEAAELARIALEYLETKPVAWGYERASCITCEGPQGFKRVIEYEAPPEWAVEEGRVRIIVELYAIEPTSVALKSK